MQDKKLILIFKEENAHLQNVARGVFSRLQIVFWGWLRTLSQRKIETFKAKQQVSIKTTQFWVGLKYQNDFDPS